MTDRSRQISFFALGVVVAIATTLVIGVSVVRIRQSVFFARAVREIERSGVEPELLEAAALYARRSTEWRQLIQLAWRIDGEQRWPTTGALAERAIASRPREATWRYIAAYAATRSGDTPAAVSVLGEVDARDDDLVQQLRLYAAVQERDVDARREALVALAGTEEPVELAPAVARALVSPTVETLGQAASLTDLPAFTIASALLAAVGDDRAAAGNVVGLLTDYPGEAIPMEERDALLVLAAWLQRPDDLSRLLARLPAREAVSVRALLLQADAALLMGRVSEAQRLYRELQQVAPSVEALVYANDVLIARAEDDRAAVDRALNEGLAQHPGDPFLREVAAAVRIDRGDRLGAARVVAPVVLAGTTNSEDDHRRWLLVRAILGRRRPVERLEADLWLRLNDHPDAAIVGAYLARFLSVRNSAAAVAELLGRPVAENSWWSAALRARRTEDLSQLVDIEQRLEEAVVAAGPGVWEAAYNRALFAVRHEPAAEAEQSILRYQQWIEREARLSPLREDDARIALGLLRAEWSRLVGDLSAAIDEIDRLIVLNPDRDELYGYRALVARSE